MNSTLMESTSEMPETAARCGVEVGVPCRIYCQPQDRGGDHQRIALFRDGEGTVLVPVCLYSLGEIVLRFPVQKYAQNILRHDLHAQRAARSLTQHKAAVLFMLHHGFPFCGRLLFLPPLPSSMEFCAGGKIPSAMICGKLKFFCTKRRRLKNGGVIYKSHLREWRNWQTR